MPSAAQRPDQMRRQQVNRLVLAGLFTTAGSLHFLTPATYDAIVPAWFPDARLATLLSGAAEVAGGLGLLHPRTRPAARWGLLALLVAVFPANLEMALHPERFPGLPAWALWARLPLQLPLLWWVWQAGQSGARPAAPHPGEAGR